MAKKKIVKSTKKADNCASCGQTVKDTLVVLVLDESGSMGSVREATVSSLNELIADHSKSDSKVSFYGFTFSSGVFDKMNVRVFLEEAPAKNVKPITLEDYNPQGGTPLYDAFGQVIEKVSSLANGRKVLFAVITDGQENSSTKHNLASVQALMKERDWQFVFMGANIDSWATAQAIGGAVFASNSMQYQHSPIGMRSAIRSLSAATQCYASNDAHTVSDFFGDQKAIKPIDISKVTLPVAKP